MPSKARKAFDRHAKDVKRLLEIHKELGGAGPGRRYRLEVLNKAAIVFLTAFWEAYCEDLAAEALDHLVAKVPIAAKLPKDLKKRLAEEIKKEKNEIAMWDLADAGWKTRVQARLAALTEERNWNLNTPKSAKINELFEAAIGLPSISRAWHWSGMSAAQAAKKLDKYIALRGAIAHRGGSGAACKKAQVEDYFAHLKRLAAKTGGEVNRFVEKQTGQRLW